MAKALERGDAHVPPPEPIFDSTFNVPYVFLGDAAFPLRQYLMTPYGGRNLSNDQFAHNRQLSRGRVCIENSFGVLAARWQILLKTITVQPKTVDKIVLAVVLLHNYLLSTERKSYMPDDFIDHEQDGGRVNGTWRLQNQGLQPIPSSMRMGSRNTTNEPVFVRNEIKTLIYNRLNRVD